MVAAAWSFICLALAVSSATSYNFPENFSFSVGSSAYQVEGAFASDGKGVNIYDYFLHLFPQYTNDGSNGDVASDAYDRMDEDIHDLKDLGVQGYKISLSWSRLLPQGYSRTINQAGVDYYNRLINKLIENNIEPTVSLFHWDLPLKMHQLGGWTSPTMQDYFADYARICYNLFGDRVKRWITFTDPSNMCRYSYELGVLPPFYNLSGVGNYRCGHTVLLSHARAVEVYRTEFASQKGKIGIGFDSTWFEPKTAEDKTAATTLMEFFLGWMAHPIFSRTGDYPKVMKEQIAAFSKKQGFAESRLPKFTAIEIQKIKGSADFVNVRHFITAYGLTKENCDVDVPSQTNDACANFAFDPEWPRTALDPMRVVPWGLRKVLNWIKDNYNNVEMNVENGVFGKADEGIEDDLRADYYPKYLNATLAAITEDGCNVSGYTFWMFMDGFEWNLGYSVRSGLYHVDFTSPDRPRTPKKSASVIKNIIKTRTL